MGMGEAARNVENVVKSAKNLVDPQLFQLAPRRVTISTVGPSPESFEQLGQAPVVLAWSVHASHDAVRRQLVPTTRYSMEDLRTALIQTLLRRTKKLRQVMLELALIDNINDRPEDAEHLVQFCQPLFEEVPGIKVVVNLIPWNDIQASSGPAAHYRKSSEESILAFQNILVENGILCYIRTTRGDDESAACGQLATKSSRVEISR
jgi:23S rRNA (adenine2503-C2)-methyltransferase